MAKIIIENDVPGVIKKLAAIIEENANEAISNDDIFKIGLSGPLPFTFNFEQFIESMSSHLL